MRNFIFCLLFIVVAQSFGQTKEPKDISIDALITETQFSSDTPNAIEMIWWLPRTFWKVSFAQDPNTNEADIAAIEELLENKELFVVINGKVGHFGGVSYTPIEELIDNISFMFNGEKLLIEDSKALSPDLTNFLSMMKPMMANMLGPMGENLHFILLKNNDKSNVLPIDSKEKGVLKVRMNSFIREVDLPLESVLIEKK